MLISDSNKKIAIDPEPRGMPAISNSGQAACLYTNELY